MELLQSMYNELLRQTELIRCAKQNALCIFYFNYLNYQGSSLNFLLKTQNLNNYDNRNLRN